MPSSRREDSLTIKIPVVSAEQEHEWRELLQKQLADHWLKLNYPEEIKTKEVILDKIHRSRGQVA
jgi:hypothetical protein